VPRVRVKRATATFLMIGPKTGSFSPSGWSTSCPRGVRMKRKPSTSDHRRRAEDLKQAVVDPRNWERFITSCVGSGRADPKSLNSSAKVGNDENQQDGGDYYGRRDDHQWINHGV